MNFDKIKQQAANYRKSPEKEAWTRLNSKLAENMNEKRSILFSKTFRYAASFLLATVALSTFYFAGKNGSEPAPVFESSFMEVQSDGIYSTEKMNDLQLAYRKINLSLPNIQDEI